MLSYFQDSSHPKFSQILYQADCYQKKWQTLHQSPPTDWCSIPSMLCLGHFGAFHLHESAQDLHVSSQQQHPISVITFTSPRRRTHKPRSKMLAPSVGAKDFDWAKGWEACGSGLCVCVKYVIQRGYSIGKVNGLNYSHVLVSTAMNGTSSFNPKPSQLQWRLFQSFSPVQHLTSFAAGLVLEHH